MDDKSAWKGILRLSAVFSTIALGIIAALAVFNQPTIDDFWYTWMVKKWGFAEAQHQWYITINARFSSNAFMSFNSLVWGSVLFFKVFPIILLGGYVLLFTLFAKRILFPDFSRKESLHAGLLMSAVYCYGMPGFYEGFLWCSALVGYQLPFLLWGFTLLFLLRKRTTKTAGAWLFVWGLFILLLSGFHELMALQITVVMAFLLWYNRVGAVYKRQWMYVALIAAATSLIFQLVSAGNLHKAQITADKNSTCDYYLLVLPLIQFAYHLVRASLLNPVFYLLLFFITAMAGTSTYRPPAFLKVNLRTMLLFTVLVLALAVGPVFLVSQIEGTKTPLRVINFSYGILFVWLMVWVCWLGPMYSFKPVNFLTAFMERNPKWMYASVCILFAAGILLKGQPIIAPLADGTASLYNQQVNQRFEKIEACNTEPCIIDCLDAQPLVLCPVDACNDPTLLGYIEKVYDKSILITDSVSVQVPLP